NSWAGFNHFDLTYQSKVELKNNFTNFIDYFENLQNVVNIVNENLEISIENLESMDKYLDFIRVVSKLEFFDSNIFRKEELSKIIIQIGIYLKTKEQYEIKKSKVLERYTEEIFNLDIDTLYQAYSDKYNKWYRFLKSGYKKDKKIIQGYQVKKFNKYSYYDVLEYLDIAKETILLKKKLDDDLKAVISLLNNQEITDFNFEKVNQELLKLDEVLNFKVEVFEEITKEEFEEIKLNLQKMLEFYDENQEKRLEIEVLQNSFDINKIKLYTMNFDEILKKLNDCLDNFDKLENWNRFSGITQKLEKLDLMEFVDKSIDNNIKRETLDLTFKSMFYMQYVYFIIERNEILSSFSRFNQDNAVKNFKSKDKLNFEISKAKIIAKISKNMPDEYSIASGSQVSTLVREANKKIKQKPVRVLFKEIGELVQKLKPCLLMSPLSVSTYLEFGSFNFDVVIFDEASQIFPWDSIGAISRAKQVIVVGDSKQMPPSNFFNAGMVTESEENENEEYEDDALDFESILDLSSAVLKQHRLKWHYRSKTEDLIAFSNANFYENSLVTFPSAYKNRDDMGINFHFVENGIFDRKSKTNKIEAERVVDLVFEHFKTHPDRSLGVVAFSISQQGAIEEAIQERREEFPEYEKFFDDSLVEPLFIKNLETVQGDERDTIIFSVGYARDSAGKFLHNFGPLNKKGGERRLNVAVTRAKYNIKLVASIKSLDIDLAKSSATGTKLLKEYLYIAEHGVDVNKENYTEQNDKHLLENEIYDFLVSKGYKVVKNIGCSEYKIDIGIKHPDNEDFVLAIECDGETYKMAKTTRDRDRLRQEVLERLGWKFYRIWSVDWFLNKPIEKESLLKNVKKAIKFYDDNLGKDKKLNSNSVQLNQEVNENVEDKNFIVETPIEKKDLKSFFDVYEEYDINSKPNPTFYNTIFDLVKKEAPITEELLLKKTVTLFGREKVTTHIRSKFAQEIDKYKEIIFKIDDYYVVNKNMMVKMRIPKEGATPRDIMHIANIELSSGMFVIIKNSVGITEVGLFNATANLLGFSRIGNNIQLKLKESLNILLKNNLVKFVNGEYFVNE
ncbi:MAG: hypothetical protein IJX17_06095, partial [Clostridia bacterium]|nr:hypothetical protein [Clostridia bacterium]